MQGKHFDLLVASHDGYQRLVQPVTHRRWVLSLKNGIYLVRDLVEGQGRHQLNIAWHLGQEMQLVEENVYRVKAELSDASAAASEYEDQLRGFFKLGPGEFPHFDLILLGLGPDGHTASLFPDSEGLKEKSRLVIANWVEKFKTHRITFTFPVLNHATDVMFLASGPDKADMVREILEGTHTPPFPAQQVQPQGRLLWMLDKAAAARMKQ